MDTLFPFGFPAATRFYLMLYALTLVIHVALMNYAFAGTGYLAVVGLFPGREAPGRGNGSMAGVLRDWMPFALGATITAGIAPLLFVQILYRDPFYTSNLLLLHRWMAIVPVLILGFYLLYLLKSRLLDERPRALRGAIGIGAFACLAFTGYSWTENHLLSLDAQLWPTFYGEGRTMYWHPTLAPRAAMWLVGAVPTMVLLVCSQLWWAQQHGLLMSADEPRHAAVLAIVGLAVSALCGVLYYLMCDDGLRARCTGRLAGPYLVLALSGAALQVAAWTGQHRQSQWSGRCLVVAGIGVLATLLGVTVVRESLRLAQVSLTGFHDLHTQAAHKGGLGVFVAFLALNVLLIGWCIATVRRHLRPDMRTSARSR